MFVTYNDKYYRTYTADPVQQIWRYNTNVRIFPFYHFCKEKLTAPQDDFEEIFDASFWATWKDRDFRVEKIWVRSVVLLTLLHYDADVAEKYGFFYPGGGDYYLKIAVKPLALAMGI